VYGVHGLKVADLSIGPGNVSANRYSTALVMGEKAAVVIVEELGIKGIYCLRRCEDAGPDEQPKVIQWM
jgi:hypothetical protein